MPTISDAEFGDIVLRPSHNATRISLRVAPNGTLRASMPPHTPTLVVKTMIATSRPKIRKLFSQYRETVNAYNHDQSIGKSHMLVIQTNALATRVHILGTKIIVDVGKESSIDDMAIQQDIRQAIIKALRKEAKSYLPRRLAFLAAEHDFSYKTVKMTHASSRWGSCSSSGTISLNISLMQLPFELLDYVLIHELCHTRHMNHSSAFWDEVRMIDPSYSTHRNALKHYTPNI